MQIYGAGLAGLLAGCHFQRAEIFEAGPEGQVQHKALLRFRSPAIGEATGIEFKKVKVHKGIWMDDGFVSPNIRVANLYARKVAGVLLDRSIWNTETVDRWTAPENLLEQLANRCADRIRWNTTITRLAQLRPDESSEPVISTLPMPVMAKMVGFLAPYEFHSSPIRVRRFRIAGANVHQTVYFPDTKLALYRASITGDLLTAEYVADARHENGTASMCDAFGIQYGHLSEIDETRQPLGKLVEVNDPWRKKFIYYLSREHNIFSLGRFGTWRNILMDDVLNDIHVIRRLVMSDLYDRLRHETTL